MTRGPVAVNSAIKPLLTPVRLLEFVKLFLPILPEVEVPDENISLDEKIIFTIGAGIIYLVSQLPIYGLQSDAFLKINDPFNSFRSVFALEKGTLLELGLLPIITSAFIWQVAAGLRLVKVNLSYRKDRELFQTAQKLTSAFLALAFGVGLVASGYYDNVIQGYNPLDLKAQVPFGSYVLILTQIVGWNFLVGLLVEIFDKGYGFGSGILSFLALQVATNVIRDLAGLELVTLVNSNKLESFSALVNLVKSFSFNFKDFGYQVFNSFTRTQLPNLTQFYISLVTVLIIIALHNFRIELPVRSTKVRGMSNVYPIRLLYTGALPITFAFVALVNLQIFGFFFTRLLAVYSPAAAAFVGQWTGDEKSSNLNLTGGLLFYFAAPSSLVQAALSPFKVIIYSATIILLSTWFANFWSAISGASPKDISKQFKDQSISISGKRDVSITRELSRVIPVASVSGAFLLAVVAVVGELLGGLGKGVGAIIGVSSAFGVLEEFMLDWQQSGGASQFSNVFGGQ